MRTAETLFADRGFDRVSLGEIAAAAGLSRGTPNYFFGSKSRLYQAVLAQVFEDRERATAQACGPLVAWSKAEATGRIDRPLTQAVDGYLRFLLERPSFVTLIQREELAGAGRLRDAPRESRAIQHAFASVRKVAKKRGLKPFVVDDAVLVFVSLTFSPLAQRATFMASLERDLNDPAVRRRHVRLVVDQLLRVVGE